MKEDKTNDYSQEALRASYAFGHIEAWLEVFTRSHGLSFPAIANRVGELLQAQTSREVLGSNHRVPRVLRYSTSKYRQERAKTMEMAEHTSGSAASPSKNPSAIRANKYYHSPDKGQYSRAVLAMLAKKDGTLSGYQLVELVRLKNPDWNNHQIWGALNVMVKHKKVVKGVDGLLRLGKQV